MGTTIGILGRQLQAYSEAWQQDHAEAMACWEVVQMIRLGLSYYACVRSIDQHWSESVRQDPKAFEPSTAGEIEQLYRWWLSPCEALLVAITDLEERGFVVDGAEEFREACREVRLSLAIPLPRLIESTQRLQGGDPGRTMGEVRDALRSRIRSRG